MSRVRVWAAEAAILMSGTVLLARWWYANPEFFPRLPDRFWQWLDAAFGVTTVDGKADVEVVVVLGTAFIATLAFTRIGFALYRRAARGSSSVS